MNLITSDYSRVTKWGLLTLLFAVLTVPSVVFAGGSSHHKKRASCDQKNVLFVLDRSGSMKEANKFDDAKKIIQSVTQNYAGKVRFGLETFSKRALIEEPIPTSAAALQRTLKTITIDSNTQMVDAVKLAGRHIGNVLYSDSASNRPSYVLFITDGKPNPPPCPINEVKALRALKVGNTTRDVKTYVIGFGSKVDPKCLNSLAVAGGTALPGARKYILASNARELSSAMNEIIGRTASHEVCNGKDDDCDGFVDNKKGSRQDGTLNRACSTACGRGVQTCFAGQWSTCTSRTAKVEVCNGKDDDCDGKVDDNARCANNGICYKGQCRKRCRNHECGSRARCVAGACVPKVPAGNNNGGNNKGDDKGDDKKDDSKDKSSGSDKGDGDKGQKGGWRCDVANTQGDPTSWFFTLMMLLLPLGSLLRRRK